VFGLPSAVEKHKLNRTTIVAAVLCERKTLSVTLREEHRLRVLGHSVLRRTSGPKRAAVTERSRLHTEELHNLYCSPNTMRPMKSTGMRDR
jgi:hypothetical protein